MFAEENKPLLEEAASIDFQFMKNGMINYRKHSKKELGLYFIKLAIEKHGNTYGYSKVAYNTNNTKVSLLCSKHGEFLQVPASHLSGAGCPICGGTSKHSREDFIAKASKVHNNIYDYSQVEYVNAHSKVRILCRDHGPFEQTPDNHLRGGRGKGTKCPICAGKSHNILYILRCKDTGWYKIGITTNTTKSRMLDLGGNLEEVHHVNLEDPRKHEAILHNKYGGFNIYHEEVRNGNTEFFSLNEQQVQEVVAYMDEVSNER